MQKARSEFPYDGIVVTLPQSIRYQAGIRLFRIPSKGDSFAFFNEIPQR
jgi:hypothetical protein